MILNVSLSASAILTLATASPLFIFHPLTESILPDSLPSCSPGECSSSSRDSSTTMFPSLFDRHDLKSNLLRRNSIYVVVIGDTGNGIAAKEGLSFAFLQSLNPTVDWYNLQIGQILQLPEDGYAVRAGDTGLSIASSFDITFENLQSENPQTNWNNLQIGQKLQIPSQSNSGRTSSYPTTAPIRNLPSTMITGTVSAASSPTPTLANYFVIAGDTGNAIAVKFGLDFDSLSRVNLGVNWNNLQIGQALALPTATVLSTETTDPTITRLLTTFATSSTATTTATTSSSAVATYQVVSGDTGYGVASKFGISFATLSALNPSVEWNNLQIGQLLVLPTSETSAMIQTAATPYINPSAHVTGSQAVFSVQNHDGNANPADQYVLYTGDGSGWPSVSSWVSFETMFNNARAVLGTNCVGGVQANSPDETDKLYEAIQAVAAASFLDHRLILAVIMQESNGCVRVPTTYSPAPDFIKNPGIMQSFQGSGTCNINGQVNIPCSIDMIYQMVEDGTMGTATGDGLVQALNRAPGTGTQAFYQAARLYNSGSMPANGDLGGPGATRCFASDIANRLTGWLLSPKICNLDG